LSERKKASEETMIKPMRGGKRRWLRRKEGRRREEEGEEEEVVVVQGSCDVNGYCNNCRQSERRARKVDWDGADGGGDAKEEDEERGRREDRGDAARARGDCRRSHEGEGEEEKEEGGRTPVGGRGNTRLPVGVVAVGAGEEGGPTVPVGVPLGS
jgi:hypothetical protein